MKALFLSLFILFSCTRYATLERDGATLNLKDAETGISHLEENPWPIGKGKQAGVTQSFSFIVHLPKLKEEDVEFLMKEKEVNAWLMRVIFQQGSDKQDLGSLYARFRSEAVIRGHGVGAPASVGIRIYFASGYPSERFRLFECPAFGHDKKLEDLKVSGSNEKINIPFGLAVSYPEKSQLVELAPTAFNAGMSLKGDYFLEIAPYNIEKKMILGSFKRLPEFITVETEETVTVSGCAGAHPEKE